MTIIILYWTGKWTFGCAKTVQLITSSIFINWLSIPYKNGILFEATMDNNKIKMKRRKKPECRSFLDDRFEILIKKQKNGHATFNELTELDEIVNRNSAIRDMVL